MSAGTLVVKIAANITDFSKGLDAAEKRLMKAGDNLEKMGGNLALKVTAPLLAVGALFAKSAAEDAASVEKMGRTFGRAQGQMEAFIGSLMKSVPETDDALRGMASSTGTLLTQMGLAPQKAAAMSQTVLRLAGDFGAFNKELGVAGASDALDNALQGKTKGLAAFGITLSEADIKAKAYQMGLAKVGDQLSHTATAQAALAAVLERSQKIQGEAARTFNDDANAMARAKQAADGVADSFGKVVLPSFVKLMNGAKYVADALTALPDAAKGAVVGLLAVAAATGPLLYAGGSVVKVLTLMRSGMLALGFSSLATTLFSVKAAFGAAAVAGTGFRGVMIGLAPVMMPFLIGGAIIAGITAIGFAIWKSGEAARKAAADLDSYKSKLASFSTAKESQASAKGIAGQLRALEATPLALSGDPMKDAMAQVERDRQQASLQAQLLAANQRTRALTVPDDIIKPPPGPGPDGKNPYAELEARAGRLGSIYELTTAKGKPLAGLNQQITEVMDQLSAALARQADKWGDVALQIRQATESLQRYGGTTDQVEMKRLQGLMQNTSVSTLPTQAKLRNSDYTYTTPAQMANVTGVPGLREPPSLLKQVSLQEAMKASLDTLPTEFAAQLGNYLGPVLAKIGGGSASAQVGGAVGGAFGNAVGGLIGKTVATKVGGMLGAGLGSMVPVLGTLVGGVVGSLAGNVVGKIGGAIAGLFGHKKKTDEAAEAMARLADQARKVAEAISGLPQGIKLAAYRYDATTPATNSGSGGSGAPGDSSGPGGHPTRDASTSSAPVFTGPITINGVTDVASFFRKLSEYAESNAGRGGFTGLQLATTR